MANVNFFDMTDAEMIKYYNDPKNRQAVPTIIEKGKPLRKVFPKKEHIFKQFQPIQRDIRTSYHNNKMFIPSLSNQKRTVNKDNVAVQKKRVQERMARQDRINNHVAFHSTGVSNAPHDLAKDSNIQKLLSEAETMIRRYNLPKATSDALKADIMRNHLPDYVAKKESISQKQKDDMVSQIMRTVDKDFDRPTGGGGAAPSVGDESTVAGNPGSVATGNTGNPAPAPAPAASGVGNAFDELAAATSVPKNEKARRTMVEMVDKYDAAKNQSEKNTITIAARILLEFNPRQVIEFIYDSKPNAQYKKNAQSYLNLLLNLGENPSESEMKQFPTFLRDMKKLIPDSLFEARDITLPNTKLDFETFKKL